MSEGKKFDAEKPRWYLLPMRAVEEIVKVMTFGAQKYGANNWQQLGGANERYFSAAQRHLAAWQAGERKDPESGLPHLAHAACCLVFMLWYETTEVLTASEVMCSKAAE